MKKVLFVLSEWSLHASPNALCVECIAEELTQDGDFAVDCLSLEAGKKEDDAKAGICFVNAPEQKNGFARKIYKFFHMPLSDVSVAEKIADRIVALQKQNHYVAVIAVMNPPETAEAVYRAKLKNRDIHYILYEIDPNSNRYKEPTDLLGRYLMKKAMRWERKVYEQAAFVIHMISHKAHYTQPFFDRFEAKAQFLDIPGLNTACFEEDNRHSVPGSFLYAGAFYPGLRAPNQMIAYMAAYFSGNKGYLDIYTGRMQNELHRLIAGSGAEAAIKVHDTVEKSELHQIMHAHRVLVSVGNKQSDFLPSKTLDYIGTNKQIIHFYSDENDTSLPYLKRYGKCLLIKDDTPIPEAVEKISSFVKNENQESWREGDLKSAFEHNTPGYTAGRFKMMIDEIAERKTHDSL